MRTDPMEMMFLQMGEFLEGGWGRGERAGPSFVASSEMQCRQTQLSVKLLWKREICLYIMHNVYINIGNKIVTELDFKT